MARLSGFKGEEEGHFQPANMRGYLPMSGLRRLWKEMPWFEK
jgi:hypothetical protein